MDLVLGTLLRIPRGTPNMPAMEFELGEVTALENRKNEIAYATKVTAPELMQIFNTGYCSVQRMMAQISFEYTQAVKFANKRKSIVILEVAPIMLQERGLATKKNPAGSEDLRNAVLGQDEEYLSLQDKVHMLEAAYEFLKSKAKGFEMAYSSAKKIFDVTFGGLGAPPNINVDTSNDDTPLIGKPRY
jgi:hypothetical protein